MSSIKDSEVEKQTYVTEIAKLEPGSHEALLNRYYHEEHIKISDRKIKDLTEELTRIEDIQLMTHNSITSLF